MGGNRFDKVICYLFVNEPRFLISTKYGLFLEGFEGLVLKVGMYESNFATKLK